MRPTDIFRRFSARLTRPVLNQATASAPHLACEQSSAAQVLSALQVALPGLADTLRIAVIHGGDSRAEGAVLRRTANPRGWKSYRPVAADIAASLTRLGFKNVAILPEDMRLASALRDRAVDLAWLNTAGVQGVGSAAHAASALELLGVPYVGHDPVSAVVLDHKHVFKHVLRGVGLPTAPFALFHDARLPGAPPPSQTQQFADAFGSHLRSDARFVVKPVCGRASQNVVFADSPDAVDRAVQRGADATGASMMVERFLPGREFCVAVAGDVVARAGSLHRLEDGAFAFSAVERVLGDGEHVFESMDSRAITNARVRALAAPEDADTVRRLHALAADVYARAGLRALVRLDVREDENGQLCVLEANPKPDLGRGDGSDGKTSLIEAGLGQSGMNYDDLILSMLCDRLFQLVHGEEAASGPLARAIGIRD